MTGLTLAEVDQDRTPRYCRSCWTPFMCACHDEPEGTTYQ